MNCPACQKEIPPKVITIENNEDDVEVGFTCPSCRVEYFCLLTSGTFLPVD